MISDYLEIFQGKSDRLLVSGLERILIVSIVREHNSVHIISQILLQSVHPAWDVEVRHEEEGNLLRAHHISQISKLWKDYIIHPLKVF